jgi:peptidoglycan/xylan/chitin deacetylase (PgdA/CDA1 family)
MSTKTILYKHFSRAVILFQIDKIYKKFFGGVGHIIMLHRVLPEKTTNRIHNHKTLEISIKQLENLILFFKKRFYNFLSIDEFYSQIKKGELKKPFVVFTFDDGYKDNLIYAYPIFEKYNVPFTIYITTNFPDYKAVIWWYILEEYIINNNSLTLTDNNQKITYNFSTQDEKERAFQEIRKIFIRKSESELRDFTKKVFEISDDSITEFNKENCLTWDEISSLSRYPLVSIGAHTVNHVGLAHLPSQEAEWEINESKRILEEKSGIAIKHFSYPFGGIKEAGIREFEMIKRLGFHTATTTQTGNIKNNHINRLSCLPRISINSQVTKSILKLHISGISSILKKLSA